jgi:hypothetical protein
LYADQQGKQHNNFGKWHQNTGDKHDAGNGDIAAGQEIIPERIVSSWRAVDVNDGDRQQVGRKRKTIEAISAAQLRCRLCGGDGAAACGSVGSGRAVAIAGVMAAGAPADFIGAGRRRWG